MHLLLLAKILPFSVYYLIEKANGIKYLYAWLDKHPDVRA
jgi:hypothetical protein